MTGKRIEHFNIIMKMSGKYIARFLCFFNMTEILAGDAVNILFSFLRIIHRKPPMTKLLYF